MALAVNPVGSAVLPIAIIGGLVVLGFVLFSKKTSATSSGSGSRFPSTKPSSGSSSTSCEIQAVRLHEWAVDHGMVGIWFYSLEAPPSIEGIKKIPAWENVLQGVAYNKVVVVTKNGSFWGFDENGYPVAAPQLKDSYCAWKGAEPTVEPTASSKPYQPGGGKPYQPGGGKPYQPGGGKGKAPPPAPGGAQAPVKFAQ